MCKWKPGPRCSGHAASALSKAQERLTSAEAKYEQAQDDDKADWVVQRHKDQVASAQRRVTTAQLDVDSTRRGKAALAAVVNDESKSRQERAAARQRLETADQYGKDLNAQREHMPPLPPSGHPARKAHVKLGQARSDLVQARYLDGDTSEKVTKAEAAVLAADINYSRAAFGGRVDPDGLTKDERTKARLSIGETRKNWAMLSYARSAQQRGGTNDALTGAFVENKETQLGLRRATDTVSTPGPSRKPAALPQRVPVGSSTPVPKDKPATSTRPSPARPAAGRARGRSSKSLSHMAMKKLAKEVEKSVKSHLEVQPGKYL